MKTLSNSPDVNRQTPLASGMALASTSVPDLLLLLQQQAVLLANQQQEIQRLHAVEKENERLKLALASHARMRFGVKSEVLNEQQLCVLKTVFARLHWARKTGYLQALNAQDNEQRLFKVY